MAVVTEIAPEIYRISVLMPELNLQFNHFLVRDEQPLLFHAGLRQMFGQVNEAVKTLIEPSRLRYASFSHFESDECGALNEWLGQAPQAEAVCGFVGAMVNINDFAIRPARAVLHGETLETGRRRFRFIPTPHVPHGWDAGVLFEETERILFCSDLFHQWGEVEPLTESSVLDRAKAALLQMEAGPLARYVPYTHHTGQILEDLAKLEPRTLAIMHGSSFRGDGAGALRDLAELWRVTLGPNPGEALYHRLGGYDRIAAIIDGLLGRMRQDPRFARFAARGLDSQQRARQLFVDQIAALAGGPCFYTGRDMKTSHVGLGITETEWQSSIEHTIGALKNNGIREAEQREFIALFERYRADIVEASKTEAPRP
ncbi:MAG TPA: hypothetical protein VFW83_00370 [Bryobacteraceae bacterium]|nr:hypothetical protein [Bryobacteraceae bacterium]